jgi:flagellar basal body-associated protein FliL
MKKLINISILVAGVLLMSGCEVTTTSTTSQSPNQSEPQTTQAEPKAVDMVKGEEYPIEKGTTIVKNFPDTTIALETDLKSKKSVATLKSGSATIYYK